MQSIIIEKRIVEPDDQIYSNEKYASFNEDRWASLDMFGKFELEERKIGCGFHILETNTSLFRNRIVELAKKNNIKE